MAIITTMEEALAYAATKLGYQSLKTEQNEAVKAFVGVTMHLCRFQLVLGSLCFALFRYVFDYLS